MDMRHLEEPYFEDTNQDNSPIRYPFSCFITNNRRMPLLIRPHWHHHIELLYFLSGRAGIFLDGTGCSAGLGDLVLINAREVHSIISDEPIDIRYIVIKFDAEILYNSARTIFESRYVLPFVMAKARHQKVFSCEELKGTPVPDLCWEVLRESTDREYGFELAVRTGICRIFLWILRHWRNSGLCPDTGTLLREIDMNRLQKLFDYLDAHFAESIDTHMAADICGMSYCYFSRQFKKVMGRTFSEYLNHVRITEAEKLLLTTGLNVTQVAYDTGFSDTSYFIKQFKHYRGISPKQLRKRLMLLHEAK